MNEQYDTYMELQYKQMDLSLGLLNAEFHAKPFEQCHEHGNVTGHRYNNTIIQFHQNHSFPDIYLVSK